MVSYSVVSIFGLMAVLLLFNQIASNANRSAQGIIAHCIAISIGLFYGLRGPNIGVDTKEYISRFENGTITEDYLFSFIGIAAKSIGFDYSQYLALIAVMTSIILLYAIKNFSGSFYTAANFLILIAILPYGMMQFVNIARQGLTVALVLFASSLTIKNKRFAGVVTVVSALFIHKITTIVYLISFVSKRVISRRFGPILILFTISFGLVISVYMADILAFFSEDLGSKFIKYSNRDTSESNFLIIGKLLWAVFHMFIFAKLNKRTNFPPNLYYYLSIVVFASITLSPNVLVASRLLASVDFIIPVLYSIPVVAQDKGLRNFGIGILILYSLVSPFLFNMYSVNFNW